MLISWQFSLVILTLLYVVFAGEDFYALLGVDKGASVKEIRKAFKKIAILKHPDKNSDNPNAHDEFIKINRAYEVLKDDDLRKRYDQYGEDGLKDDHERGRRYESWQFYQNKFGIYDDDPEIITLSRSDFEQSVEGTSEPWFINFYSTYCSHCHDLAPTWREMARELEGVIRIGAVNCADDWQLCRMQGIHSYPSLVFYPQRSKYNGDRSLEDLVEEALMNVKASHFELQADNFDDLLQHEDNQLSWLITFCGEDGDCLETKSCIKLAAMLADLANVGHINCVYEPELCEQLGHHHGTFLYAPGKVNTKDEMEVSSLDAREIANTVLHKLPDVQILSEKQLQKIEEKSRKDTWLIHFVDKLDNNDLELRKLPAILHEFKVGRVDCSKMSTVCSRHHVVKYPTFILFKQHGGKEVYYGGRVTAHDVSAWVHDSANAPMENLSQDDFPDRVVDSKDPWFVDFFAPWCPPCMRLLPEFKKASKFLGARVNFGTVDCTVHQSLCRKYNINSYPTTIFYNMSVPHQYHGHHSANSLLEFVEDTMNPPVISLTMNDFEEKVTNRPKEEVWLVDFFAPWCGPCQQLAPEWRKLAKIFKEKENVFVAQVDCVAHKSLCHSQNVHSYPQVRLYGAGRRNSYFMYNGWHRDAGSLRAWAIEFLPTKVVTLTTSTFTKLVLESTTSWIVDFYAPWCGHCQVFRPEFEKVAEDIEGIARAGKVDCDAEPRVCQIAGIRAYPTVRFYKGAKRSGQKQHGSGWDIQSQNAHEITDFVKENSQKSQISRDEL